MNFIAIEALNDNYMYLFYSKEVAISVDPVDYLTIIEALSRNFSKQFYKKDEIKKEKKCLKRALLYSLTTHSHYDHSGGNQQLKLLSKNTIFIAGFGGNKCYDGDIIEIKGIKIECIHTPCHTKDSFCYLINFDDRRFLLTGDTIFFLGCGRFLEGDGKDMVKSLQKILSKVEEDSLLLYGHDYNKTNIAFASKYNNIPTYISEKRFLTLKDEKNYNPFFKIVEKNSDTIFDEMQSLRDQKDLFGLGNTINKFT